MMTSTDDKWWVGLMIVCVCGYRSEFTDEDPAPNDSFPCPRCQKTTLAHFKNYLNK
jgi:hypothetical protein